jgi:hypothetical protein
MSAVQGSHAEGWLTARQKRDVSPPAKPILFRVEGKGKEAVESNLSQIAEWKNAALGDGGLRTRMAPARVGEFVSYVAEVATSQHGVRFTLTDWAAMEALGVGRAVWQTFVATLARTGWAVVNRGESRARGRRPRATVYILARPSAEPLNPWAQPMGRKAAIAKTARAIR